MPQGLRARILCLEEMLPCVGQGALGIEIRQEDFGVAALCENLNHFETNECVKAERAFLAAMGGGCASPVAGYAEVVREKLRLRAMSFPDGIIRRAEAEAELGESVGLGERLPAELKCQRQSVTATEVKSVKWAKEGNTAANNLHRAWKSGDSGTKAKNERQRPIKVRLRNPFPCKFI